MVIVEEVCYVGIYVCVYVYIVFVIKWCLEFGVCFIEYGNYIDMECVEILYWRGVFLVFILVIYDCIKGVGEEFGMFWE